MPCRRFLASIRQGVMDSTSTAARASLPTEEVKTARGGGEGREVQRGWSKQVDRLACARHEQTQKDGCKKAAAAPLLTVVVAGVGQVRLQALDGALALHRRLAAEAQERKHGQAACMGDGKTRWGRSAGGCAQAHVP